MGKFLEYHCFIFKIIKFIEKYNSKNQFFEFYDKHRNTKNDWIYHTIENLELYVISMDIDIDIGIDQNASSHIKSYKNDKMKK